MITQFNREALAKNLPDAYRKDGDSNNHKILEIERRELALLREALATIYESLDIDKATGKTLDLYGAMVGQARGVATDEQLRILIKNRIIRNFSNGDFNSIVNAICMTFDCEPSEVGLTELDDCKVVLDNLPLIKINESGIDIDTAVRIVVGMLPAGVLMESMNFSGTFEFSGSTELEYDAEKGFGNEEQTIGGYLGLASYSANSALPV